MQSALRLRLAAVLLALAIAATGCSLGGSSRDGSDEGGNDAKGAVEQPETLAAAWEAPLTGTSPASQVFSSGGALVRVVFHTLHAHDPASGAETWSESYAEICHAVPAGEDRLVVVSAPEEMAECRTVQMLDGTTGDIVWERRLKPDEAPDSYDARGQEPVSAHDGVVTVITQCCYPSAVRLDAETGERLEPYSPADGKADGWVISGSGLTLSVSREWFDDPATFTARDASTLDELWTRSVRERNIEDVVLGILSADPLILSTSERGHQLVWTVDAETGEKVTPLGRQIQGALDVDVALSALTDDTAVLTYGSRWSDVDVIAADLETGNELWEDLPGGSTLLGLDSTDQLVLRAQEDVTANPLILRASPREPEDFETLGRVEARGTMFLTGDRLVVDGGDSLTVYDLAGLPAGPDVDVAAWRGPFGIVPAPQEGVIDWADGEVRFEDLGSCQPDTAALKTLGFHQLDLPPVYGCRWREWQEPVGVQRELVVRRWASEPTEATSATEAAREELRTYLKDNAKGPFSGGPVKAGPYVEVSGLGDEAYLSEVAGPGRFGEYHLLVRVANVVVDVSATQQADTGPQPGVSVANQELEDGALEAARSVFAQSGLDLDLPERSAGRQGIRKPVAACGVLRSTAGAWAGGKELSLRAANDASGLTDGCYWGTGTGAMAINNGERIHSRFVSVTQQAIGRSRLTGTPGTELARTMMRRANSRAGDIYYDAGRKVPGLGDEAYLYPSASWSEGSDVLVRIDNLVFQVSFVDQADEDLAGRDAQALTYARQLAASYRP